MRLGFIVLLLCACVMPGSAQVGEVSLSFGESLFKDNKIKADDLSKAAKDLKINPDKLNPMVS